MQIEQYFFKNTSFPIKRKATNLSRPTSLMRAKYFLKTSSSVGWCVHEEKRGHRSLSRDEKQRQSLAPCSFLW